MAQSGPGKIKLFTDFTGAEIPVGIAVAHTAAAGYYIGDYAIKGDTDTGDAGVVALSGVTNGGIRLTTTDEDGKSVALCTDTIFSPALNGPIVVETRVEMQALTAREAFVGICDAVADDVANPLTYSSSDTIAKTASDYAGFYMASELSTAPANWHAVYNGGTTSGPTDATEMDTGVLAVAGEYDILRVVIERSGTVEWWINGNRVAHVKNAVSTSVIQGVICGPFSNTTTVADLDVDYLLVNANRDWTR